ncbi:hypothetical protein ACWEWX_25375 [Streptomyces asiaticus]
MTERNTAISRIVGWLTPSSSHDNAWFPGRVIGGTALVVGPVVWFVGLLLRYLSLHSGEFTSEQLEAFDRQPFAAPSQLAAYAENPTLVTAAYTAFALGTILMCPAVATLARVIAVRSPGLAFWGGTCLILGLFARLYFAGVDQTAFELVEERGTAEATHIMMDMYVDVSYGLWRVPVVASVGQGVGTLLLALGAYRAGVFGPVRGLLFLLPGMGMGVLKETTLFHTASTGLVCFFLVPIGVRVLRDRLPELRSPTVVPPSWDHASPRG